MKSKTFNSHKLNDIKYEQKYLFLNCPKCHEIPHISFDNNCPQNINIKCDKCTKDFELPLSMPLDKYLKIMKDIDLLKDKKKCFTHNNFLDTFCYKCHIQFCSKCPENNNHKSHKTKIIEKKFSCEKIEKGKKILEYYKDYFKKYISEFLNNHINNFSKSRHYYIKNALINQYINDMTNFFHFGDCIILNYDKDYPNYYQQMNLHNFFKYLNEEAKLMNLNERKLERIFKYSNNNYIKYNGEGDLIKYDYFDLSGSKILDALLIDEEFILIKFIDSIKLYNFKNKKYISTLDIKENNFNEFGYITMYQIYKDIIILKLFISYHCIKIKILSLFSNNFKAILLYENQFDFSINNIKRINNNSLGFLLEKKFIIYEPSDTFENISYLLKSNKPYTLQLSKKYEINFSQMTVDFVQTLDKEYFIFLFYSKFVVYKCKDLSIFKEIKIEGINFDSISEANSNNYILGGRYFGMINIKDWSLTVLYNENIKSREFGYLSGSFNSLDYSEFVLTYFNKLICRRLFYKVLGSHFGEESEVSKDEKALCIFDFNPEKNTLNKIYFDKSVRIEKIFINSNDEIIIVKNNHLFICYSN